MKAFLSYSLNDSQQYILTILARKLNEGGFYVNTPSTVYAIDNEIIRSNLFIGILSSTGDSNENVINEWNFSIENKIPSILLVEDNIPMNHRLSHPNIIYFNRFASNNAVKIVQDRIKQFNSTVAQNNENALAWVLGGVAVIALIKLLSEDK